MAARQKHHVESLETMKRTMVQHHVGARLYWKTRTTKAANKAKTWALNVQDRAAQRAEIRKTLEIIRASNGLATNPRKLRGIAPSSPTYDSGLNAARAAVRAGLDHDWNRDRGMSR